jgi:hypothetical protein
MKGEQQDYPVWLCPGNFLSPGIERKEYICRKKRN